MDIAVRVFKNAAPVNGLTDDPEITIQRLDTGAAVVSAAAMTDKTAAGLYSYTFEPAVGLTYSFLIDADPQATGQVDTRYFDGAFDSQMIDLLEADHVFDYSAGLVHHYKRGTTDALIPAKNAVTEVQTDTSITE